MPQGCSTDDIPGGRRGRRQGGSENGRGGREGGARVNPGNQLVYIYIYIYIYIYTQLRNDVDRYDTRTKADCI